MDSIIYFFINIQTSHTTPSYDTTKLYILIQTMLYPKTDAVSIYYTTASKQQVVMS